MPSVSRVFGGADGILIGVNDFESAANVGQRRAKFMRDQRHKFRFQVVKLAQFFVGDLQLSGPQLDFLVQFDIEGFDALVGLRQQLQVLRNPVQHAGDDHRTHQPEHDHFHAEIEIERILLVNQVFGDLDPNDDERQERAAAPSE